MAPKPRTKKKDTTETPAPVEMGPKFILPARDPTPSKPTILPQNLSSRARIFTHPHPVTGTAVRFLYCPVRGVYEFTRIASPKSRQRSFLLTPDTRDAKPSDQVESYVTDNDDLLVATPFDALFLALPFLARKPQGGKQLFLSLDDHLDTLPPSAKHLRSLLREREGGDLLEKRVAVVCDSVEAGDEKMYRLSVDKLCAELLAKARRMVKVGLPLSLEERFVRQVLVKPVLPVVAEEGSKADAKVEIASQSTEADSQTSSTAAGDSQSSVDSTATNMTSITIPSTSGESDSTEKEDMEAVTSLLRTRVAFNFIVKSYLPNGLQEAMIELVTKSVNFTPLDTYLSTLEDLRRESQALRAISDNISRKRLGEGMDDEEAEQRAEKKRKKEEEERRKKDESRAAKQLKKVDTSGMKKLSAFFAKAPVKGKT